MGIKPKAIARIGSRSVLIPFPTKGETPLAPPIPLAPHEPTGVTTSASSLILQVTVSWTDASTDESGFYVYRNTSNTTTGATLIATLGAGVQTYVDNDDNSGANAPAEGTTYYYWVSSFNAGGESVKSPAASNGTGGVTTIWLVPTAPSSLSATAVSSSQINLSWTDNSNNETGFEIFRSTDGLTFSSIATVGAGVTTYNNTGLSASTQYYYKVWAYNPGENSTYSNTANATTQAASGVPTPTFEVNFTTNPYVGTRFSRASRGTFVNSSGFIQAAELNGIIQSEDFSTTWVNQGATVTVNATTAPDGSTTADRIVEDAGSANHARRQDVTRGDFVYSCYLKADQRTAAGLRIWITSNNWMACSFDLSAGTAGSIVSGSGCTITSAASGITSVGNGWYRCWIRGSNSSVSMQHNVEILSSAAPTRRADNGAQDYTGNTANGIFAWGAQSEAGNTAPGMYVRTTTASNGTPRITHDPVTLAPLGLLVEAQATNRALGSALLDSGWTLAAATTRTTQNSITTPRGASVSATKLSGTSLVNDSALFYQEPTLATGNYTLSVYAKADGANFLYVFVADGVAEHGRYFDLSNGTMGNTVGTIVSSRITNAGNGWYRCVITWNNPSVGLRYPAILPSTTNATGRSSQVGTSPNGVLVTAVQFESGSAETSWIETTTAAVTRSADTFGLVSADLGFWNSSAGSVVAENTFVGALAQAGAFRFGKTGTDVEEMYTELSTFGTASYIQSPSSAAYSGPTGQSIAVNTPYKVGFTYSSSGPSFQGFRNGAAGTAVTTVAIPPVQKVEVGVNQNFGMSATNNANTSLSMILRRLRYWNTALSNADMQTATT